MKTPEDSRHSLPPVKRTQLARKASGQRRVRVNKQQPVQKSQLKGCFATLGAIAALIAAGGLIVGGIWLGILLMINPNAIVWLNRFLPEWTRIPIATSSPVQTLTTIQKEVRKSGLIPGEPIALNAELLLPLLASLPNCQTDCEKIVEFRVYQPSELSGNEKYYRLVSQLPITEPEEYFVLSAPGSSQSGDANLSRSLPLKKLSRFEEKAPATGFWFNLVGQRLSGDTPMTYGQVIQYNPEQMHLSVMLQWTSPNELQPYWQQVTGTSTPELVVNQTVGLEPEYKVYQIRPRQFVPNPIYLEEIALTQPAIETQAYRNALMLVRSGLWSPAVQWLQAQKKKSWSAAAQGQMDVIQLHAQVTQSQAKEAWASPSQQILAYLMDGRWADALLSFQAAEPGTPIQEIVTLLKTESEGLWQRVEAGLKVNPKDINVKAWGALILAAQQGRPKSIAWLKQLSQPKLAKTKSVSTEPEIDSKFNELLDHLDAAFAEALPINTHLSQIVGTARLVKKVNPPDWLQPEENPISPVPLPLQLEVQQVWYQIQVAAFNDGQRWRQMPFTNVQLPNVPKANQLWRHLGLDTDSRILITVWTAEGGQESTIATVKAASYRGGVIQLLAAGEALPAVTATSSIPRNRPLAYTDTALRWLDPDSVSFSELSKLQPRWMSLVLPSLWRELIKSGQLKSKAIPSTAGILQETGNWSIRAIDLTGNNQPEAVLTVYEDHSNALKKPNFKRPLRDSSEVPVGKDSRFYKPRTLIFSDTGVLLYSEFSKDANTSLTAIADLGDGGPAALVINEPNTYRLKRWSAQGKRFE